MSLEPKKLALLRIWQILKEESDFDHPLKQEDIAGILEKEYGIIIERKAIARNLSLLKEAGVEIGSRRAGCYLECREFEDSELRMLIDGILSSKHITAKHSKDLIERLCALSNKYFRSHVKHVYSVNDWSKTDNQALFYNIELIDTAIETKKQIHYDYNKYGVDKKLHKSSQQYVTPYQMILHNQRYYLMAYSEYWGNMVFHRLDRITNMTITDKKATPLSKVEGYPNGVDFKEISSTMPYMYPGETERVEFLASAEIVDQIVDWFGDGARIEKTDDEATVRVRLKASPLAMEHWALQYAGSVRVTSPDTLVASIRKRLQQAVKEYEG